jgi:UDP-N-acetyl-D-glucosamine dehydrogenase
MHSVELSAKVLADADLVLVMTDHTTVDYQLVANTAKLVVDARGAMRRISGSAKVVGLSGTHTPRVPATRKESAVAGRA